jgi:hypothetical protein
MIIKNILILSLSFRVLRKKTFDKNDEKKAISIKTINNFIFKFLYPSLISFCLALVVSFLN